MFGRDFLRCGDEDYLIASLNDGNGLPYEGPVKVAFVNRNKLAVIDRKKNIHIQLYSGYVELTLCHESTSSRPVIAESKDDDDDDELNEIMKKLSVHSKKDNSDAKTAQEDMLNMKGTYNYMDITAFSICRVPMTKNIAIADCGANDVKVLNTNEWYIDRSIDNNNVVVEEQVNEDQDNTNDNTISKDSAAVVPNIVIGKKEYPFCIDTFQLGYEFYFVVIDQETNMLRVMSEGWKEIASIGGFGPKEGQFKEPVSISCYCPPVKATLIKNDLDPSWFYGEIVDIGELHDKLEDDPFGGNFLIGQREGTESKFFDLCFYNNSCRLVHQVIRKNDNNTISLLTLSGDDGKTWPSIWDLIKSMRFLKKCDDPRPYVLIAVAEIENYRVQVFKYYWTKSNIFSPSLELAYVVGGYDCRYFELGNPCSVSFSSTGELAICDSSKKQVLILSQYMDLVRVVNTPHKYVISNILKQDRQDKKSIFAQTQGSTELVDKTCVSVSFSPDGKLAVGFKNGGVLIHANYKHYKMGFLSILPLKVFDILMEYFTYSEAKILRDTSRYLHNLTRRRRTNWSIYPMRPLYYESSIYLFQKWSRTADGGDRMKVEGVFKDWDGDQVCHRFLNLDCGDKYCSLSHKPIKLDVKYMNSLTSLYLELESFKSIVTRIFGARFLWQYEAFIHEFFKNYGSAKEITIRHDPMTRACEVKRTNAFDDVHVLSFKAYIDIMTSFEEQQSGLKPIECHPLFQKRKSLMADIKLPTNLASTDLKTYHDAKEQYSGGLKVPFAKPKSKRLLTVKGMENEVRGKDAKDVTLYNEAIKHQSDRLDRLSKGLFS